MSEEQIAAGSVPHRPGAGSQAALRPGSGGPLFISSIHRRAPLPTDSDE